jgi:predicted TIM-barrel fold metal-dependent hydrolase
MYWEDYEPVSTLVVPEHPVRAARFPFIDIHAHQFRAASLSRSVIDSLIREMDGLNMAIMVNLSGGSGEQLKGSVDNMNGAYPGRFAQFANISFDGIDDPDWGRRTAAQLEADVRNGAVGLKIYKSLGMQVLDASGSRVRTDDPRIDPVWSKCGELGIPVLIHTADPAPFWDVQDRFNERWFELKERPQRIRPADQYPPFATIIAEQHNMFRKHPETNFISAHLSWLGNDLDALGALFDELPNVYSETGAVLAELGRQPRKAKEFLTKYKDRILFGKDSWEPDEYRVYFRTFETEDEYFDYYRKRHAFWKLYGLGLSDDVLKHLYYKNALRLVPGLDASQFPE